jgi:glutamate-1-semialdehyde 2,1-aminomutase
MVVNSRYQISEERLERARRVNSLGSQTFSKSTKTLPLGASPLFVRNGCGCMIWDVDNNSYIDLCNGLASVLLGYAFPIVDEAVAKQLKNGVTFSLPHTLEIEVSELLVDLIPCAEMVRFAKNGTDVTSAAVRLARHITGRDHIAICGYHGWQDWSIATTNKNSGIPKSVRSLSSTFDFNDIASLEKIFHEQNLGVAAVILEPVNRGLPDPIFLKKVRDICTGNGALLIFDEIISGFRVSIGGAQELYGIKPDLATFGKGMGNGHPIAALVGRKEALEECDNIFFSGTFAGETLSLAAAQAAINFIASNSVPDILAEYGGYIASGIEDIIIAEGLTEILSLEGHPSWKIWRIGDSDIGNSLEIKTFLMQELFLAGIFMIGSHNVSYSIKEVELNKITGPYQNALGKLGQIKTRGDHVAEYLTCSPPTDLFKVR